MTTLAQPGHGEPDAGKLARPVRRGGWGDLWPQCHKAPHPYPAAKFTAGHEGAYQAHHIIEKKWVEKGLIKVNADEIPAVILTDAEHKLFNKKLAEAALKPPKNPAELWSMYQEVYKNKPYWLKAIESYFVK
jgi:hypothetical protein